MACNQILPLAIRLLSISKSPGFLKSPRKFMSSPPAASNEMQLAHTQALLELGRASGAWQSLDLGVPPHALWKALCLRHALASFLEETTEDERSSRPRLVDLLPMDLSRPPSTQKGTAAVLVWRHAAALDHGLRQLRENMVQGQGITTDLLVQVGRILQGGKADTPAGTCPPFLGENSDWEKDIVPPLVEVAEGNGAHYRGDPALQIARMVLDCFGMTTGFTGAPGQIDWSFTTILADLVLVRRDLFELPLLSLGGAEALSPSGLLSHAGEGFGHLSWLSTAAFKSITLAALVARMLAPTFQTARQMVSSLERMSRLPQNDVAAFLLANPVLSIATAREHFLVDYNTAFLLVKKLLEAGLLVQIDEERSRERKFVFWPLARFLDLCGGDSGTGIPPVEWLPEKRMLKPPPGAKRGRKRQSPA